MKKKQNSLLKKKFSSQKFLTKIFHQKTNLPYYTVKKIIQKKKFFTKIHHQRNVLSKKKNLSY
jgi:hypothetical protein